MSLYTQKMLSLGLCSLAVSFLFDSGNANADIPQGNTGQADILCGATTLKLSKKTLVKLRAKKVKIAYTESSVPPNVQSTCSVEEPPKGAFRFSVLLGQANPALQKSLLKHSGGLRFKYGKRSVRFTNFVVNTEKGTITANAGKRTLTVFTLKIKKVKPARAGALTIYRGVRTSLTRAAAQYVKKSFGSTPLKKGFSLGQFDISVAFKQLLMKGGATTMTLDPASSTGFQMQDINLTPLAPSMSANGGFVFPVVGGRVDPKLAPGVISYGGGIVFSRGDQQVQFTSIELRFEVDKALISGFNGMERQDLFGLVLSDQVPSLEDIIPGATPVTFGDITLKLTPQFATALNQTFLTKAFSTGLVFGTASVKLEIL